MQSVRSVLEVEILKVIRAAISAHTSDETDKVVKRYSSVIRRARLFGYDVSAITFGDTHQPVDVRLKPIPVARDH